MMKMQCACGAILEISGPIPEIVNMQTFTALVFNHALISGNVCKQCGSIYLPAIQGFDPNGLKFGMQKIEPPVESSRIVMPN
jgi:hypothetical protein